MQRVFLLSVPHSLTVMLIKPGMYCQGVLGSAKNEGLFFYPQILTFPKCLRREETNILGGNLFVTYFTLKTKF